MYQDERKDNAARQIEKSPIGRGTFSATDNGKNVLSLLDQAVVSGTSFLTTVVVGRTCGPQELGNYALAFSIALFVANAQESLISTPYTIYGNRLQRQERCEYAGSNLLYHILLSALAMTFFVLASLSTMNWAGTARLSAMSLALAGALPFMLLREFGRRLEFAHLNMANALRIDIAVAVLQMVGLGWLAAKGHLSAITAFLSLGGACSVVSVIWLISHRHIFVVKHNKFMNNLRQNWELGKWIFASQITSTGQAYVLYWLVALFQGTAATGAYAACWTVVLVANPLRLGIGNALSPQAARAFSDGGKQEVRRVVTQSATLLLLAMTVFCALLVPFGGKALVLLYGEQYAGHEHTVIILGFAMLLGAVSIAIDHGLKVIEMPNINFRASVLGLLLTLLIVPFAVPGLSILGAAYADAIGTALALGARWIAFSRATGGSPPFAVVTHDS